MDFSTTEYVRRLQEYPEISCEGSHGSDLPAWRYMPADSPPLVELRTRYGLAELVAGRAELPAALANWPAQLVSEALAPMRVCGIILMAVGAALLIVSFVYKRHHYDYLPE